MLSMAPYCGSGHADSITPRGDKLFCHETSAVSKSQEILGFREHKHLPRLNILDNNYRTTSKTVTKMKILEKKNGSAPKSK